MRDIRRKCFGCVNALAKGDAHVGQSACQHPNLIAARGQARYSYLLRTSEPYLDRSTGKMAQGSHNRAGQKRR